MPTTEGAIEQQNEYLRIVSRTMENLMKTGEAKRTKIFLQTRLSSLEITWQKFTTGHDRLLELKDEVVSQLPYFTVDVYSTCEQSYAETKADILQMIQDKDAPVSEQRPEDEDEDFDSLSGRDDRSRDENPGTRALPATSRPNLPRINLPKFDGSSQQWRHFRDLFLAMTGTGVSEVEKLHYLNTCLTGEPAQMIKIVKITERGFERAWSILTTRYDNARLLIDGQLNAFLTIKPVKPDSAADLKQLYADMTEALGALSDLGCATDQWDPFVVHLISRKLDIDSVKDWERTLGKRTTSPTRAEFEEFLITRIHMLEACDRSMSTKSTSGTSAKKTLTGRTCHNTTPKPNCPLCSENHALYACSQYKVKSPVHRRDFIIKRNLCFNCLGNHNVRNCKSTKRCTECGRPHHSSIHGVPPGQTDSRSEASAGPSATSTLGTTGGLSCEGKNAATESKSVNNVTLKVPRNVSKLLPTALVYAVSKYGHRVTARALLDQCAETSLVSEALVQKLCLRRQHVTEPLLGAGGEKMIFTRGIVTLQIISPIDFSVIVEFDASILPWVTAYRPDLSRESSWCHLDGLELADPDYSSPRRIDLLLGSDLYALLVGTQVKKGPPGAPMAQTSLLGWIISGPYPQGTQHSAHLVHNLSLSADIQLLELLQNFWCQQEISSPPSAAFTMDELDCEKYFAATYSRDVTGRFCVRLPLKSRPTTFGDSKPLALKMLHRMERRFETNQSLRKAYIAFLSEYEDLKHMKREQRDSNKQELEFFLPHHGVQRTSGATTKLRVVFNGSQKTALGLNDHLHCGAKLQTDLSDILLRWRRHLFVFAADIEKMYRQINVHEEDWPLQRIVWRDSPEKPAESFSLCTVTYGLTSAPFLAIRCLLQLAADEEPRFPEAAQILRDSTYVDDIFSGADTIEEAVRIVDQLRHLLTAGGFPLKKWISNDAAILTDVPASDKEVTPILSFDDPVTKTLGLAWNQKTDRFSFLTSSLDLKSEPLTKRKLLSHIAKLYDPLGWFSPVIIRAKILIQELWAERLDWDDIVPQPIATTWNNFATSLQSSEPPSLPRWIGMSRSTISLELHGFADASQSALAAAVYLRAVSEDNAVSVALLESKTKVAPLKRITIPRLELCSAVLLVRLTKRISSILALADIQIFLWTDSTVALAWIQSHPSRWREFVRNRTTEIQDLPASRWRHVPGSQNPADLATRGVTPNELHYKSIWWNGPAWLHEPSSCWPDKRPTVESPLALTERAKTIHVIDPKTCETWEIIHRYSTLTRLLRITAWCRRAAVSFKRAILVRQLRDSASAKPPPTPLPAAPDNSAPLDPTELQAALHFWIKTQQVASFPQELSLLAAGRPVTRNNPMFRCSPFLDDEGLIRIRGRLRFTQLHYDERHPILLPRDSILTTLIIRDQHFRTLHGGTQSTLAAIRRRFWILGGRRPVRSYIHRCMKCARFRAASLHQPMGQLPFQRTTPGRAFLHTGVDYAGPFYLKTSRTRGAKVYKGYLVLFVCMATSALHLEMATDYSTDGFLAAFRRFVSRRGICATLTSDRGTNFVGADRELQSLFHEAASEWQQVANILATDGTKWIFNPPAHSGTNGHDSGH